MTSKRAAVYGTVERALVLVRIIAALVAAALSVVFWWLVTVGVLFFATGASSISPVTTNRGRTLGGAGCSFAAWWVGLVAVAWWAGFRLPWWRRERVL